MGEICRQQDVNCHAALLAWNDGSKHPDEIESYYRAQSRITHYL